MTALIYLVQNPGDILRIAHTKAPEKLAGNRIIGIKTKIPDDARIIQGGLSSPFWTEVNGEAGIAGTCRIEPPDPRK